MRTIVNRLSQSDSAEAWKQVTYFFNNCFIYDLKRVCCLQTIIILSSTKRNNLTPFHFELISSLAYYPNLLGLSHKRIFQSVKPPFQTLAKFFFDILEQSNLGMELFNVVTTSARPTPPVITQPTSSADIVTTVSPGTHPARVKITMPTAKTVDIFFIFYPPHAIHQA